ncbi:MAG: hypothetical protein ACRCS0_10985 [Albidovulum sp.]
MKALDVAQSSFGSAILSAPSFLRIAIPSWRAIGIQYRPEPAEEHTSLSREEIQALFRGELSPNTGKYRNLTEREQEEVSLAERMRRALYPDRLDSH